MPKHFSRPHIGKIPMKFYFRAQEIAVMLPGMDITGKLVLTWKRGPRRTTTEPFAVKEKLDNINGSLVRSASTMQDLALICTMFKNSKSGAFEPKSAAFTLKEEMEGGSERKLGSVTIDLSSYATPEVSSDAVELSFCDGKIILKMKLSSHWLKHMKGGDDDDESIGSFDTNRTGGSDDSTKPASALSSLQHVNTAPNGGAAGPSAPYVTLSAEQRRERDEAREKAIDDQWGKEETRLREGEELESLREELRQMSEKLENALAEAKYHCEKGDRLSQAVQPTLPRASNISYWSQRLDAVRRTDERTDGWTDG